MNSQLNFLKATILFAIICSGIISCNKKSEGINISKDDALEIAKRYNIYGDSVEIYFKTYIYPKTSLSYKKGKRKLLYWHVSKECNGCGIIQIDAESGKVFSIGKYEYQY